MAAEHCIAAEGRLHLGPTWHTRGRCAGTRELSRLFAAFGQQGADVKFFALLGGHMWFVYESPCTIFCVGPSLQCPVAL